jgi:predicted CoA-substrate-specific enzyme activase
MKLSEGKNVSNTIDHIELGIDVGSTTVKGVVLSDSNEILFKEYRRHNSHQPETVRDLLELVTDKFPNATIDISVTGSGSRTIAPLIGAKFIQEVNAVTVAVETFYPEAGSVMELGGQDAKVIIWKGEGAQRSTLTYMNDKCAGGTGSTVDKIMSKVGLKPEEASKIPTDNKQLHQIAAKCGVFAETDVVGLLKAGVDREEIFISLCNAIVKQNLEVLVRGNVLEDKVLLLGGPNTFIPAFASIWREQIKETWELHGYTPKESDLEKSIIVPEDSHYFAALGAVLFSRSEDAFADDPSTQYDKSDIEKYIASGRSAHLAESGNGQKGLIESEEELEEFRKEYEIPQFKIREFDKGTFVNCFIGIDGGSTSTKMVLTDEDQNPFYRDYVLSTGNPIEDAVEIFKRLSDWEKESEIVLNVLGTGATGYASEILKEAFNLDSAVVETVAHMKSAVALYGDVDIICDVGGQDIKVLFMKHGRVVDFKLNTQCSAGNGYFLQGMADQFNIPVEEYAENAFKARQAPIFNYGCAVFMEQDRVNFQQAGWTKEEMMAGLALVLPLNIWNYVVQEANLARLGKRFVLQGGTQKNLAAAKAQVDFIKNRVPGAEVFVHKYADVGGAIGAALEVTDHKPAESSFVGLDAAKDVKFQSINNESTVCNFCSNKCKRTFVDIDSGNGRNVRFIAGYACEKGAVEDKDSMQEEQQRLKSIREKSPNIVDEASKAVFAEYEVDKMPKAGDVIDRDSYYPTDALHHLSKKAKITSFERSSEESAKKRAEMRVGIPKLLNQYYYTPFYSTYLKALGIGKVVYSDFTSEKLWSDGNKWGAIDPCFPAKVAPAHVYNLLTKKDITQILFPIITHLESTVEGTLGNTACVIQMGTPEVVEAVFSRDRNLFEEKNVDFWDPCLNMDNPIEIVGELYDYFKDRLGITKDENAWAVKQGRKAMREYLTNQRNRFAGAINDLIEEDRMGLLLIGHPYHHDPGLNHDIPKEFQKLGYPVFTIESIPESREFLNPLFTEDEINAEYGGVFGIREVWQRNFNRNTNHKIWAAKVAARHPNIGVIDLSSFKCGHDAPTYSYVEEILDASDTPHFSFHDIDQNRPGASFKIRIQTIDYFLKQTEAELRGE